MPSWFFALSPVLYFSVQYGSVRSRVNFTLASYSHANVKVATAVNARERERDSVLLF